jgi:hypothetical protein
MENYDIASEGLRKTCLDARMYCYKEIDNTN